jgi:hypothetical protein
MELTIIGVYEELAPARSAKHDLIASGFSSRSVQLNPDHELSTTRGPSVQKSPTVSASIENFFRSLFSMDDKSTYSNLYAEAVRRGNYVLTVDVDSDALRIQAEQIMNRYGPMDIDERSADWVRHGWRGYDPQQGAPAPPGTGPVRAVPGKKKPGEPE